MADTSAAAASGAAAPSAEAGAGTQDTAEAAELRRVVADLERTTGELEVSSYLLLLLLLCVLSRLGHCSCCTQHLEEDGSHLGVGPGVGGRLLPTRPCRLRQRPSPAALSPAAAGEAGEGGEGTAAGGEQLGGAEDAEQGAGERVRQASWRAASDWFLLVMLVVASSQLCVDGSWEVGAQVPTGRAWDHRQH
jgi:hypothetical protein